MDVCKRRIVLRDASEGKLSSGSTSVTSLELERLYGASSVLCFSDKPDGIGLHEKLDWSISSFDQDFCSLVT